MRFVIERDDLFMQPSAGINRCVSHANLFDLLKIEKPLAIEQCMKRHNSQRLDGFNGG
jgi:hypothetical protein